MTARAGALALLAVLGATGCGGGEDGPLTGGSTCREYLDAPPAVRTAYVARQTPRLGNQLRPEAPAVAAFARIIAAGCRVAVRDGRGDKVRLGPALRDVVG